MVAAPSPIACGSARACWCCPYRNPVNLAAEAAALDVLSDGRFILGVGAGWMREEFATLGIDPAERGARTDEHIEVLRTLWTQDPASFDGRFTSFDGIVLATTPRTEGGPPIWVGGNTDAGLRRALRLRRRLARVRGLSRGHARCARAPRAARRGGRPRPGRAGR